MLYKASFFIKSYSKYVGTWENLIEKEEFLPET